MLSNITTLCFAGSYAVTLVLEVSRLLFKSGVRGALMIGFAAAGLFAHTAYLVTQAAQSDGPPLSSASDWCLMAAWVLAAAYLFLVLNHPRDLIGLFVLPLVLALVGAAQFADPQPLAEASAQRVWGLLHGAFLLAGTVAVLVGFVSGLMYLVQAWRLKHKVAPSEGLRLPSLEWLDGVNARAIQLSTLLMALGFVSGLVLGQVRARSTGASAANWSDPLVWSLAAMLAWLLTASVFTLVYRPARHGRKVAYLTVASMLFLLVLLGTLLFRDTVHKSEVGSAARAPDVACARRSADLALGPGHTNPQRQQGAVRLFDSNRTTAPLTRRRGANPPGLPCSALLALRVGMVCTADPTEGRA